LEIVGWGVAGAGFGVTFFMGGGPGGFAEESSRHLAGAGALAFGFLVHWLALWSTRQKAEGPRVFDERDLHVMARANQASLVVVLVGVFALAIGLWAVYEERGSVPAGWMWFMAYGSVILAFLTSSVATLALDRGMGGHG
jgi:sterol desaturase/sphingolipid hydroxylase (fatty acid hydroxylase superfamily)